MMRLGAEELQRLSRLLDAALEIEPGAREAWLASLSGDALALAPTLRELFAKRASKETGELIDQLPAFTAPAMAGARGSDFAPGATVGPYRLLRELGRGGMGEVWLAERIDGQLKREVALKLPVLHARRNVLVQRFARERDILASLAHPHIARLYDAGLADDGQPYLALEYVEGQPITQYCRQRALDARARIVLLLQVMAAVQYAHANLVIHRDLKPSNVLVTDDGRAMLLDFGIAKLVQDEDGQVAETELTRLGGRALTPDYAAPEQIAGGAISIATDVYALGVLLYELLADQRPFKADGRAALERAVLSDEPSRPSQRKSGPIGGLGKGLAADLDTIALKALKKAPAERYATVNALAEDLERFGRGEAVLAQPDSRWYRLGKFIRRNKLAVGTGSAFAAVVVVAGTVSVWQAQVARREAQAAEAAAARERQEAQRAQAVQGFLLDIFRSNSIQQGDPLAAQKTSARDLLDIGAARIAEALRDSPQSQLEVRGVLADMYVQLGLRDRAAELHRGSIDIARRVYGARSPRIADVLLSYADTLHEGAQRALVPGAIDEAVARLDAAGDTTSFMRAAALLQAARYWRYESMPRARSTADAAVAFFTRHHPERASLVTAQVLAGRARMLAFDHAAALVSLRGAVEAARKRGAAAPAWLVGPLTAVGEAQQALMQYREAEASFGEALGLAVKTHGEEGRETLLTRTKLANLLLTVGRTREGREMLDRIERVIERDKARLDAQWRTNAAGLIATTLFERGRPDRMESLLQADIDDMRQLMPRSGALAQRERQLAEVLAATQRIDAAEAMLAQAQKRWRAFTAGEDATAAETAFALTQARVALAAGRAQAALDVLDAPRAALAIDQLSVGIERARALLALGRSASAVQAAAGVLQTLEARPGGERPVAVEAAARLVYGQALASLRERASARLQLQQALDLRTRNDEPGSVERQRVQRELAALDRNSVR